MTTLEVRTQRQLDDALAAAKPTDLIAIRGDGRFGISGSATVWASDSATVMACAGGDRCPHRRCCNPAHLEAVSHLTNVRRGRSMRKPVAA